ncbi:MAG: hypothetical protein WC702_00030 [Patescibacteria group bacterium]|jgi:hypothetical protein
MRVFALVLAFLFGLFGLSACEAPPVEAEVVYDTAGDPIEAVAPDMDADMLERTNTYYIYNPTSGGCSSALWLKATGSRITKITPSGCVVNGTAATAHPSWDSLTSSGTSTLQDTWYNRSNKFDKDYTSATGEAWCGNDTSTKVKVIVVGTSISHLYYWFTDDGDCIF